MPVLSNALMRLRGVTKPPVTLPAKALKSGELIISNDPGFTFNPAANSFMDLESEGKYQQ